MYICGQSKLLSKIDHLIDNDRFPRFCIIVGETGHGKKLISDYISKKLGANLCPCGVSVEDVRNSIELSYNIIDKTVYMFFDCDSMSIGAKNALLKVTEEPPNNAYYIMTVRDISSVLGTIISRGTVLNLDRYTVSDLQEYVKHMNFDIDEDSERILYQICVCPNDINIAVNDNILNVYNLADKVIQFIGQANIGNELKITSMLSTKKDDEKIDPVMFMRCINICCNKYILENCTKSDIEVFDIIIKESSKCISALLAKGCNRQITLDNWIVSTHLKIRGALREHS